MSDDVKRPYNSSLRADHADRTRRTVVSAATGLFLTEGYGQATIDAIARAAGVSRKTVFNVGTKVDLLKLAVDWATTGDDDDAPLSARVEIASLARETDPDRLLVGWAELTATISARLAGLSAILVVAAGIEPEAHDLRSRAQAQRLTGARAFARHLSRTGVLRPDLPVDDAADLLWLYSDPVLHHQLVTRRGWSQARFQRWLAATITQQLHT